MSFDLPALPMDWSYAPLDSCSLPNSVTYGVVQPGSALESGKPLIRVNNFRDTRIDLSDVMYIAPSIEAKYTRTRLKGGEVLVTVVGSVGQVAVVSSRFAGFNVARAVAVIHPLPHIAPDWIALCLRSPLSQHLLGSRANTTVQTTINLKDLRALPIPLPPEDERRAIAEFVGALDDRITLLRETNATLEAIAQALFKSWFVDFDPVHAKAEDRAPDGMDEATAALFPDSFEESELGLVPKGWRAQTLAEIAGFQNGYAFKSKDWQSDGHPVVKIGDVKPGIIDLKGCSYVSAATTEGLDRFRLNRGDLLVGMTGYVGETGLVPNTNTAPYLNQRVGRISTDRGIEDLGFVYCAVRSTVFKEFAEMQAHGSAQANVSGAALMGYRVVTPTSGIYSSFVSMTHSLLESILSNHEQADTLSILRDTLLPRLMSGQLRLPAVFDEFGAEHV
ncbi:restriction endonuclease subunit S [Roseateles sp. GG27B]